jgi:outer membrane protein OmpA-like peptidoglycan-associated protein
MVMRKHLALGCALTALAAVACGAGAAPEELHTARDAFSRAEGSPAPQLSPVQLDEARQALTRAEEAFKGGDGDREVKDLSYIAMRKAENAMAAARLEQARRDAEQAKKDQNATQMALINATQGQLSETRDALQAEQRRAAEEQRRLDEAAKKGQAEVERVKAQLEEEKKAREAAEKKAAAALASLEQIAKVKEESRGVVITLSGSVLFATGKHELLPIARDKLNEVAKALNDQGFKKIIVEGHTDARGSASQNEALSLARAQEVRTHLVSQGLPADKVEATGYGPRRPIADNNTTEGRANNRRVEIVVTPL